MTTKIILVGGLSENVSPSHFVGRLTKEVCDTVIWEWVSSTLAEVYQPSRKSMNRFIDDLRKWQSARKKADAGGPPPNPEDLIVVKLVDLHGRAANQLFSVWPDPKIVPSEVRSGDELLVLQR